MIPMPKVAHNGLIVELAPLAAFAICVSFDAFASSIRPDVALRPTTTKKATAISRITKPLDPIFDILAVWSIYISGDF